MKALKPMAAREVPPSVSHCRRVNPDNGNGSPAAKPKAAMT